MTFTSSVIERQDKPLVASFAPPSAVLCDADHFQRLLDAATELRGLVAQRARQTELDRRVSDEVTQLLKEAGLYRVVQPRRFGGYELGLEALRRLAFEIGQGLHVDRLVLRTERRGVMGARHVSGGSAA